jgi:hypothetical protein
MPPPIGAAYGSPSQTSAAPLHFPVRAVTRNRGENVANPRFANPNYLRRQRRRARASKGRDCDKPEALEPRSLTGPLEPSPTMSPKAPDALSG